jgi:signal transduction histidine kinase/ligand-binding sensor domain-containing protein/DNA-binding response OmpR family regulator
MVKNNSLKSIIAVVFLLFITSDQYCQRILTFQNFSVEDGLSSLTINCIFQDSYGFIWFGTSNGLNRFDSYSIDKYILDDQRAAFQRQEIVYEIFEDKDGNLLIGTDKGLFKYIRETDSFHLLNGVDSPTNKLNLSNYAIRNIVKDQAGDIWIGTFNGLNRMKPDSTVIQYKYDPINENSINTDNITDIHADSKGNLIVATTDGFAVYNQANNNFQRFFHYRSDEITSPEQKIVTCIEEGPGSIIYLGTWGLGVYEFDLASRKINKSILNNSGDRSLLSSNTIFALKYDYEGNLWIGTENGGLNKFEAKTGNLTAYKEEDYYLNSIAGNTIRCIITDNHNDLWIGTYMGGISKLDFNKITLNHHQHLYNIENTLSNNKVTSFLEVSANDIWIGTDGGGINRFNPVTGEFNHLRYNRNSNSTIQTDIVMTLQQIDDEHVWVGTYNEGINVLNISGTLINSHKMSLKDSMTLSGNNISTIFQDSYGRIWTGIKYDIPCLYLGKGKFIRVDNPKNSNHALRDIRSILEDSHRKVWMGSNGYLYRLDSINNNQFYFKKFNIIKGSEDDFITTINSLELDKNGNIWVGTQGKGLIKFNPLTSESVQFTVEDGLPSNDIAGMTSYEGGSLWVSTEKGIVQINTNDTKDLIIKSYDKQDGLQGNVFNVGAALTTSDGRLLFGGNGGFNTFFPWKIHRNEQIPPLYITGLQINHQYIESESEILHGKSVSSTNAITLEYNQNTVSLYFTAVNLKNSDKNIYRYRLDGFEDSWNYAGIERKATYTNISPGKYSFHVQAANNDGVWNLEGASIDIIILPPWYLSYWAISLYVLLIVSVVLLFRKFLLIKERRKNELEVKRIEAEKIKELNDLKLHFFTNISHEIRTPLSLIVGPLQELLNQWSYNPKQKLLLDLISRNTNRLFQLIDQLMDFRKLENESLPFQPTSGEIVRFMKMIFNDFEYLAVTKEIKYTFESSHADYLTYFDADKLQKILNNLLSNAFKFTPENGYISLFLNCNEEEQLIQIEICDDGIGIDQKHIDKIFNPFYQAHDKYYKKFKGTGVGLSLCKSLVEIMNGVIDVRSSLKNNLNQKFNTIFSVTFPMVHKSEYVDNSNQPLKQTELSGLHLDLNTDDIINIPSELPTVLVVEDNPDIKVFIKYYLSNEYNLVFALHGLDGLQKAKELLPDIIISDVIMPEMDGIEMCELLKSTPETSHIPIIMLTAKNTDVNIMEGLNSGADSYITKPFNINILKLYLKNTINARKKLHEQYQSDYSLNGFEYSNTTDTKFLKKVIDKIKENISETEFGVDELAKEAGMSRTNFYKKIKNLTGLTVNEFIKNIKLKIAADLLLNSDYNINEVSYQIGFKDASYFSRCFKETFGSLPKEFIKKHLHHSKA